MKAPVLLKTFNHAVFPAPVIAGNELTDSSQASLLTAISISGRVFQAGRILAFYDGS